jgi:hypothetical protein
MYANVHNGVLGGAMSPSPSGRLRCHPLMKGDPDV